MKTKLPWIFDHEDSKKNILKYVGYFKISKIYCF